MSSSLLILATDRLKIVWILLLFYTMVSATPAISFDRFTAHGGPVRDLALSPDGRYFVSASFDYSAVLWSSDDISEVATLHGHEAALNTSRFSPNGEWLATAGDDGLVLVWPTNELHSDIVIPIVLRGHKGKVVHLAFSPDGKSLASASWDGTIGIWPIGSGLKSAVAKKRFIKGNDGPVNAVQFSDDSKYLYSAGYDGQIRYWKLENDEYLRSFVDNGWSVSVFAVDETRGILAFGSSDGVMKVIQLSDGKELLRVGEERVPVLSIDYNKKAGLLGFGNAKGRVLLADTNDWSVIRDFHAANGPIWSLLVLPDRQSLMVAGLDDFITRWPIYEFPPKFLDKPGPARRFHPKQEISNGENQFARKCSVCHTLRADGKRRAGPSLFGVFGREAGGLEGYSYSLALERSDIIWSAETINRLFEEGPDKVTPGTKMPIQRMKNAQDREDLVSFLQSATQN